MRLAGFCDRRVHCFPGLQFQDFLAAEFEIEPFGPFPHAVIEIEANDSPGEFRVVFNEIGGHHPPTAYELFQEQGFEAGPGPA
jgi:hypothetical protein